MHVERKTTVFRTGISPISASHMTHCMTILRQTGQKRTQNQGYTLAEVMVAVLVMALIMLSVYGLLNSGFGTISVTREEERATQIMTQKLEAIRLLTWPQLSNCPTTFQETYNPQG